MLIRLATTGASVILLEAGSYTGFLQFSLNIFHESIFALLSLLTFAVEKKIVQPSPSYVF